MSVCARVFAATLMAGAIGVALAFPAFVGDPSPTPQALTAPPSTARQTVRVPASAAFALAGRGAAARRRHERTRVASPASLAAVRVSPRSSATASVLNPSGFSRSPRPVSPAVPAAAPPPPKRDEPTPVTAPAAPQPATPPPAPQPQEETRELAAVSSPVATPPPAVTAPAVTPPAAPPTSDVGEGCDDDDDDDQGDEGNGHGHGHAYGHYKDHDGDDDDGRSDTQGNSSDDDD